MRQVSEVRSHDPPAQRTIAFRFNTMAIHEMGNGHRRPFANGARILSTPYHPCANGQAESTNKTIIQNLKKKLESTKGKWIERLPEVLWSYQTTPKSSTGKTPLSLVYGAKELIPVEVGEPSARFRHTNEGSNNETMATALELLVRMAAQKQKNKRYYNRRTNIRYFGIRDLVLRKPQRLHPGDYESPDGPFLTVSPLSGDLPPFLTPLELPSNAPPMVSLQEPDQVQFTARGKLGPAPSNVPSTQESATAAPPPCKDTSSSASALIRNNAATSLE
uniref:Integrase catalytic domain-containing protein n=1 Tax=Nicotiana tabacum TaxID=4097 RepID=A0A1S4BYY7_TOBAC|nr:PREDICTED: uncharacterized protein LOC107813263 [Nicotiana tabacum]